MEHLFVYGSLQPGGPKAHVLEDFGGEWRPAVIKGNLKEAGWAAAMGYPGLVLDDSGSEVQGYLLTSPDLDARWADLDAFEGEEYKRVVAPVTLSSGEQVQAQVYVLRAR